MLKSYLANTHFELNLFADLREYQYFLRYSSDDQRRATILSVASNPEVIQLLLDAKADVNPPGCASVLTAALIYNRLDSVNMLIDAGASLQACVDNMPLLRSTISLELHFDKREDKITILNMLLAAGAKTRSSSGGPSVLHEIIRNDDIASISLFPVVLNTLLKHDPGLLEARDIIGKTPLLLIFPSDTESAGYRMFDDAEALLDAGADPTACDDDGETLFMKLMAYEDDYFKDSFTVRVIEAILKR
jgi:ankyrin repeat protein